MRLHLIDTNAELANAWQRDFADMPDVFVSAGNILECAENTIVSPANGYGLMDGGIDEQYTDFFGDTPQRRIQDIIARRPEGILPVGAAVLVETGHSRIPYMISAPTMVDPQPVGPENAFRAMSATLRTVSRHTDKVTDLYCPGLGTGIGRIPPDDASREMAAAYRKWVHQATE